MPPSVQSLRPDDPTFRAHHHDVPVRLLLGKSIASRAVISAPEDPEASGTDLSLSGPYDGRPLRL